MKSDSEVTPAGPIKVVIVTVLVFIIPMICNSCKYCNNIYFYDIIYHK